MDQNCLLAMEDKVGKSDEEKMQEIIQRTYGMALLHGVEQTVTSQQTPEHVVPMPFTLFPSLLPRRVLEQAFRLQPHFQRLVYDVSRDHDFLKHCLCKIIGVDEFTRRLWDVYETVRNEGAAQEITFMLTRNDFMMEADDKIANNLCLKQVEFNTFASGAGGVISGVRDIHRYSLSLAGIPFKDDQMPENCPVRGMAKGMSIAWEAYGNSKSAVLFIVGYPEPNTPDQRWLERELFKINSSIPVIYRTFPQILKTVHLGSNQELFVDGMEIAVVYFRYGYSPNHYPTEKEWGLRLQMERSRAVKCPSAVLHLAGCKKVQQELTQPGVLERFVKDQEVVQAIRATFVGQISLDDIGAKLSVFQKAKQHPDKFLLKPQREGGGNNLFGDDVHKMLSTLSADMEKSDWILMEKINAVRHRSRLIRNGISPVPTTVVSELGIFGVYIATHEKELWNTESGFLLRTKPESANEGGLFNGLSCLDSPYLV